jgi:hypothetical protein
MFQPCGTSGGSPFTPSCTPSTNFLARTTGLTNAQKTNYDNLICGLETDSVGCTTGAALAGLWVLAAPDSTTSLLNLCSSSFSLTSNGTIPFSANNGYTGDGSSGYLDTGISPDNGFFSINSEAFGAYVVSTRTTSASNVEIGASDGSVYSYLEPLLNSSGLKAFFDVAGNVFPNASNTQAKGSWVASRTGLNQVDLYLNGSLTPLVTSGADVYDGGFAFHWYISALNSAGTAGNFSNDQIAFAFVGRGLTAAEAKKLSDRLNTFAKFSTGYGSDISVY